MYIYKHHLLFLVYIPNTEHHPLPPTLLPANPLPPTSTGPPPPPRFLCIFFLFLAFFTITSILHTLPPRPFLPLPTVVIPPDRTPLPDPPPRIFVFEFSQKFQFYVHIHPDPQPDPSRTPTRPSPLPPPDFFFNFQKNFNSSCTFALTRPPPTSHPP